MSNFADNFFIWVLEFFLGGFLIGVWGLSVWALLDQIRKDD